MEEGIVVKGVMIAEVNGKGIGPWNREWENVTGQERER